MLYRRYTRITCCEHAFGGEDMIVEEMWSASKLNQLRICNMYIYFLMQVFPKRQRALQLPSNFFQAFGYPTWCWITADQNTPVIFHIWEAWQQVLLAVELVFLFLLHFCSAPQCLGKKKHHFHQSCIRVIRASLALLGGWNRCISVVAFPEPLVRVIGWGNDWSL